jgi:hypothetical protein
MSRRLTLKIPEGVYKLLAEIAQRERKTLEEMGSQWITATVDRIRTDPLAQFVITQFTSRPQFLHGAYP